METRKIAFYTLGCKLNYSETSSIGRIFTENGYEKVNFQDKADIYVINTCSVTDNADKKCRKVVKEALKFSPEAFIVIVGCYAQLKPKEISEIPGVDLVLGAAEKFEIVNYLNNLNKKEKALIINGEISEVNTFISAFSIGDRTRTFLKIQDGCDYSCSFCTIPLARGKSRSDTIENVLMNAQQIADSGVKEIVLTGVNIGDFNSESNVFFDLVNELENIKGIDRFRISSIEPNLLEDRIIEKVSKSKKFVPHFHIPLQSGSNKILALMRRRYKRELYTERVNKIKTLMPHCSIGVDVIVGFPGENQEDFLDTYNFLNELDISYLHVFTYSERENTKALELPNPIPSGIRAERSKMLHILSEKKKRNFYQQHLNQNFTVLFEAEQEQGNIFGFTENYIKVKTAYDPLLVNELKKVKLKNININGDVEIEEIFESLITLAPGETNH